MEYKDDKGNVIPQSTMIKNIDLQENNRLMRRAIIIFGIFGLCISDMGFIQTRKMGHNNKSDKGMFVKFWEWFGKQTTITKVGIFWIATGIAYLISRIISIIIGLNKSLF